MAGALIRVGHLEESERHLVIPVPADSERIRDNVRERLLSDADGERLDRASAPVRRLRVREVALRILREEHAIFSASALTELVNQVSDEVVGIGPIERLLRDPEVSEGILTYGSVGEVSVACFRERLVRRINMRTL